MTLTFPEAVTSRGKKKVLVLTTEPAAPAAITTTEIAAGVEVTMHFLNQFAPGGSQNKGNGPRRVGERAQLQRLGDATFEAPTLTYIHDPQGDSADEVNKAKTACAVGAEVWILERAGIDVDTAVVATDKYRLHHLELGEQFFTPSGDDEFAIEQVTQESGYLTPPMPGAVVAPG